MKKSLLIIALICSFAGLAQPGLYRHYPSSFSSLSWMSSPEKPKQTADGGYVISNWRRSTGIPYEGLWQMEDGYTIKTDSAFVPLWKKNYTRSFPLPTGGVILIKYNSIEKVSASGAQVWMKYLSSPVLLNDAVVYGNKIRFVGSLIGSGYICCVTMPYFTSYGFTLLTDTSGAYISHQLYQSSVNNPVSWSTSTYPGSSEFSRIKRDTQGNFFVYSSPISMTGVGSQMAIAKFDTAFSFLWARNGNLDGANILINDIDILPNGRIFASGQTSGNSTNYWTTKAALLKLDALGNMVSQTYFENRQSGSGLVVKSNGNYVSTLYQNDSLFMYETDTSMNVAWFKFVGKGYNIGTPVIHNNKLFTPRQFSLDLVMASTDLSGTSCSSYSMSFTKPTSSLSLLNFTLNPISSTVSLVTGTVNSIDSQSYIDSCKCPVFIPTMYNNVCVGNTTTVNIAGTGNLSWYGSATGNDFIQSGSQYTYTSNSPTVFTIYAQDSACVNDPNRTPVNITVNAVPTLSFSPPTPSVCSGYNIFVSALGATSFTWSHNLPNGNIQNLIPNATTIYTVTGSVAPSCSNTNTLMLSVVQPPTITATSSGSVCTGQTATITATGATNYLWSNGQTVSSFTLAPSYGGLFNFNVAGNNGACNAYASTSILAVAKPIITILSTPSLVCAGRTVTITAAGAGSYTWSTGNTGSILQAAPVANTVYVVTGANSTCLNSATINLSVHAPPAVLASVSQSIVCSGMQVTFSATGATSYTWSNGPTTNTFSMNPPVGMTTLTLTGSDGTCTASHTTGVFGAGTPTISTLVDPPLLCEGQTATITASGASSYTWANGPSSSSFTISPNSIGQFTFLVSGIDSLCMGSAQATLSTIPVPTITVIPGQSVVCDGSTATFTAFGASTYTWGPGINGPDLQVIPITNTVYLVTGTGVNGCVSTAQVSVSVQSLPPLSIISPSAAVCIGTSVSFSANGATSYIWGNGSTSSVISFTAPSGVTTVILAGSDGTCAASISAQVVGVQIPTISITSQPTLLCEGQTATVSAHGANNYIWNNMISGGSVVFSSLTMTTINITGAVGSCSSNAIFLLSPQPTPSISVSGPSVICAGETLTLQAAGASSFTWNTGAFTPVLVDSPTVSTNYTVQGVNQSGCASSFSLFQQVDLCLGVSSKQKLNPGIRIFPNPNNGTFYLQFLSKTAQEFIIELYSIDGRSLITQTVTDETTVIGTLQLPRGVYLLRIKGTDFISKIIID